MSDQARTPRPGEFGTDAHGMGEAPTLITRSPLSPPAVHNASFAAHLVGKRLAHFQLEEPIGHGGMAAVCRAIDLQLDRVVALKILPPDLASDAENVRRFENEARAAARLDHENVARAYFSGFDQGLYFIAFEFVEGINLRTILEQQGRLPVAQAAQYVLQIARGLAHAARRGVVHRDVKPSNVIVTVDGRAKLVDMGLARNVSLQPDPALTQNGVTLGTFDYISPEQALEPHTADVRSDIYSLGCTFYHLVTGRSPAPEGTPARKMQFHQQETAIDPQVLNPGVAGPVADVLARMMAKKIEERYQTPEELVDDLQALVDEEATLPSESHRAQLAMDERPWPPWLRYCVVFGLGVLFAVFSVGLLNRIMRPAPSADASVANDAEQAEQAVSANKTLDGNSGPREGLPPKATPRNTERAAQPLIVTVRNVQELRNALQEAQAGDVVQLDDGIYDLAAGTDAVDADPILLTRGPILLEAKEGARPIVRGIAPSTGSDGPACLIHVKNGHLTLRRLAIELQVQPSAERQAALAVEGGYLGLEECEFVQKGPAEASSAYLPAAIWTLATEAGTTANAHVEARNSVFWGGSTAFLVEDAARIALKDCAFGSYDRSLLVREAREPGGRKTTFHVSDCSLLVGTGSILQVESGNTVELTLLRSIVSQPENDKAGTFLSIHRDALGTFQLRSERNYFHNLDVFLARLGEAGSLLPLVLSAQDLRRFPALHDARSTFERLTPWLDAGSSLALKNHEFLRAFRANARLAALRPQPDQILGPKQLLGQSLYVSLPPISDARPSVAAAEGQTEYVVDGEGIWPGSYRNLGSALNAAEGDGEVNVTIRLNGPLPTRRLDVRKKRVTIKAAPGYHPELVFSPEQILGADGDATMFVVQDGEVSFEQIAFRLAPLVGQENVRVQSAVTITGMGRARFKSCMVTIGDPPGVPMSLVAVADPTGVMMGVGARPAKPGGPTIEVEDCFLRGQGSLVDVRGSRPFRLDCKNVLAALEGSLVVIEGNRQDAVGNGEAAQLNLERVTTYLRDHLVALRATTTHPVHVPVRVTTAMQCLFVAAEGQPLLRIDGLLGEPELRRRLAWQGKRNYYVTSGPLLAAPNGERSENGLRVDALHWHELWGAEDDQPRFLRSLRFAGLDGAMRSFVALEPADFLIQDAEGQEAEVKTRGADLDRLPRPRAALEQELTPATENGTP